MMENYHESDLSKKIPSQKEKVTYQKKKIIMQVCQTLQMSQNRKSDGGNTSFFFPKKEKARPSSCQPMPACLQQTY